MSGWENDDDTSGGGGEEKKGFFNCGGEGHMSQDCPTRDRGEDGGACRKCGEEAHFAKDFSQPDKCFKANKCELADTCKKEGYMAADCEPPDTFTSIRSHGIKREASSDIGFGGSQRLPKLLRREGESEDILYAGNQKPSKVKRNSFGGSGHFKVNGEGFTEVYTDGACLNNGRDNARAGVGVWFGHGHKLNVSRPVVRSKQTNNTAEIQAASVAIQQAVDNGVNKLLINTDSQFLINCVTMWIENWKKNGWMTKSKQPVKNRKDLEEIDKVMKSGEIQVKWKHVKGHGGIEGNVEADKLAVKGAKMSQNVSNSY